MVKELYGVGRLSRTPTPGVKSSALLNTISPQKNVFDWDIEGRIEACGYGELSL